MRSCTEYKATRRPLIDSVRSNLQALLGGAAEVDSKVHFLHDDQYSVDNKSLEIMKDTKTDTQNELCRLPVHIEMETIEKSCQ